MRPPGEMRSPSPRLSSWRSPTLWSGPLVGRLPLSKVSRDQFLRQFDHRGHVAEDDFLPPGVSRTGSQSGDTAGARSALRAVRTPRF